MHEPYDIPSFCYYLFGGLLLGFAYKKEPEFVGFYSSPYVLQQFTTLNLYLMKIKEQTRKLAQVAQKSVLRLWIELTKSVTISTARRRWRGLKRFSKSIKWFVLERLELKDYL